MYEIGISEISISTLCNNNQYNQTIIIIVLHFSFGFSVKYFLMKLIYIYYHNS